MLHGFALSLLIPESHYAKVAQWVDRTHLNNRLVYFRIREQKPSQRVSGAANSLVDKLALKSDSRFYGWLESEMNRRFDYACCDTLDQFRREPKAIMPSGQIKASGERHEKDDRTHIADRSHYVLGWTNEAKLAVLEKQAKDLQIGLEALAAKNSVLYEEQKVMKMRMEKLQQLGVFESFQDLDWKPVAVLVERLEREKQELEIASDILRTLSTQLKELEKSLEAVQQKLDSANGSLGENRSKQANAMEAEKESLARLAAFPSESQSQIFPRLEILSHGFMGQTAFTVESCDNGEKDFREALQNRIDGEEQKRSRLNEKIVSSMIDYRNAYPLETQEVDARAESAGEFSGMLSRLQSDDLPRHEEKFKKLLNENTIREVANFQSQLHRERQSIKERIELINKSLEGIDYNHGTYIRLEAVPTTDSDIRDFQQDLRACTDGALTGSEEETYSEAKFLQVKHIIGRFRGREGSTELDMRWRERTTDVRNWFVFSASERWRENNVEREHYSDSGGKSGGQKEKLAYTILAASLAYQFGLESGVSRARSFRFVVIDEAFGRGSDESARFGLELFKSLNLQLLIVTPLQKIHIIEPHVSSVGFVHNEDGKISFLRNLTIEEYRNERDNRNTRKA